MYTNALVLAFGAVAVSAVALPQGGSKKSALTYTEAHKQCNDANNGQGQVSCCNSQDSHGGLLNVLSDLSVLGGNCNQISVPISIAVLGSADSSSVHDLCSNRVACCPQGTENSSEGCKVV